MKRLFLITLTILFTSVSFAQKKDRLKGSKTVSATQRELETFENLEIEDNIEVFLIKGGSAHLEIEADDNLHDVIKTDVNGVTLRIYTDKNVTSFRKLSVRITYTESLKNVTAKHESTLNALSDLELENITIKNLDYSKSFLNVKSKNFSLLMNDKTTAELNLKAETSFIELSKNAEIKALIASPSVKFDMYQKTVAIIEGDAENAAIRLDNNAEFTGKKFTVKNLELTAEGYSKCNIMATDTLGLTANGKAEAEIFGAAKIELKSFSDNAVLYKKEAIQK